MQEVFDKIEILWPILVAMGSFILYKFIPFMKTRINKYEIYDEEVAISLITYEMVGALLLQIFIAVGNIFLGKSTWNELLLNEYIMAWPITLVVYLVGVGVIILYWKKKKEKEKRYLVNIVYSGVIYFFISWESILILTNTNNIAFDCYAYVFVVSMLIIQGFENLKIKKIKNVRYLVFTNEINIYKTPYEPIKNGKYYYIRIVNNNKEEIKRIQIPENNIKKIEHIIENNITNINEQK